jgi:hypothetical protein
MATTLNQNLALDFMSIAKESLEYLWFRSLQAKNMGTLGNF